MSVLMTLRAPADVAKFEKLAIDDPDIFTGILRRAKERGLISHRFWASETEIFVVDEWPNEEAFNGFFQTTPEIQQLMQHAGVTAPPQVSFWRSADTRDEYPPAK
jgi:heme-degrading monooxygenase HmoA